MLARWPATGNAAVIVWEDRFAAVRAMIAGQGVGVDKGDRTRSLFAELKVPFEKD